MRICNHKLPKGVTCGVCLYCGKEVAEYIIKDGKITQNARKFFCKEPKEMDYKADSHCQGNGNAPR